MAGSMNKVIVIGRIGKDPEVKYTQGGQAVANFSVATDEGYKDRNTGDRVEKTEWHRIVCWRQQAEYVSNYLAKGRLVLVEGKLQTRKWQDQNGQDRYTTEIVANSVQGLDSQRDQQSQQQPNNQQNNQAPQGGYQQPRQQTQQGNHQNQGGSVPPAYQGGPAFPHEASGMDDIPF